MFSAGLVDLQENGLTDLLPDEAESDEEEGESIAEVTHELPKTPTTVPKSPATKGLATVSIFLFDFLSGCGLYPNTQKIIKDHVHNLFLNF